jgi:hypothetical protein
VALSALCSSCGQVEQPGLVEEAVFRVLFRSLRVG